MNNIVSISILILSISVAVMVTGMVAYLFDLDDLFRKVRQRMEIKTTKLKQAEYERGRVQGRKDFAMQLLRSLDAISFFPKPPDIYQVVADLKRKIFEECRK